MRMNFLNDALGRVPEYRAIENAVRQRKTPVAVTGLASIHKANILHTLLSAMSKKALFIAGDEAEATRMLEDLNAMGVTSAFYPLRDFSLRDTEGSSHEYERQRIEALTLLQTGQCTCIVTTIDAALQYVLPPKKLKERTVKLSAGRWMRLCGRWCAVAMCAPIRLTARVSLRAAAALWTSTPPAEKHRCVWNSGATRSTPSRILTRRRSAAPTRSRK